MSFDGDASYTYLANVSRLCGDRPTLPSRILLIVKTTSKQLVCVSYSQRLCSAILLVEIRQWSRYCDSWQWRADQTDRPADYIVTTSDWWYIKMMYTDSFGKCALGIGSWLSIIHQRHANNHQNRRKERQKMSDCLLRAFFLMSFLIVERLEKTWSPFWVDAADLFSLHVFSLLYVDSNSSRNFLSFFKSFLCAVFFDQFRLVSRFEFFLLLRNRSILTILICRSELDRKREKMTDLICH